MSSLDEKVAFSHPACRFGKWYDTVGVYELEHLPEFLQIEALQKELHDTIKSISSTEIPG
ncbi:MAG: CZB domain-containing protein [Candidatus Thiodiazotropha weberae]|uniref:CZB domain-containing protein n=1 Tax=Candidatus Thiodiazotropha endoloripes TaxID=1818881 RepID=UPI00090365AC|nr:CZB domain-containing protein [Candidatus Thiodiazotropha endoloripes]MCG7900687.1 CZB domain-containing protein [Candidatus Thiodiazotropha weberae]MCG7904121.1 CZB domain-containing protein [Candidatus Thiodiazotropha weberae]MCG7912960.1 CZB domain-containing protein [Candidatus Thiodiazotropha weberae]